ncbi:MAG: glycolate oxidase subunit GlcF [Pseudomonadales bacterium]
MQTELPAALLATDRGRRADEILRSCVHCGFCNATCPTYQLLGDELDGPRGRIYLIKDLLETGTATPLARTHLDRCLTCRACETTCPSGVQYGELLEIGRETLEAELPRPPGQRWLRRALLTVVPRPRLFARLAPLGRAFRWLLPARLRNALPPAPKRVRPSSAVAGGAASGRVLLLDGCVQRAATPDVNAALADLLGARGIEVVRASGEGCCGGLALHLGEAGRAHDAMAGNVDALAPHLDQVDAVISTASGCGVTVKDYGRLMATDPGRAATADRLAGMTMDVAEYLASLGGWQRASEHQRVAWHAPCTLQHGQRLRGVVEKLLTEAGYQLTAVADPHLCCGSAGTYSVLQPALSEQLRDRKVAALEAGGPTVIATANVGCQLHLAQGADIPVVHWLTLLR